LIHAANPAAARQNVRSSHRTQAGRPFSSACATPAAITQAAPSSANGSGSSIREMTAKWAICAGSDARADAVTRASVPRW
jgi:hypothetical protein